MQFTKGSNAIWKSTGSPIYAVSWIHSGLHSAEHSKNNKSFKNKIYYITMILYLNYKSNIYKVENVNGGGGR